MQELESEALSKFAELQTEVTNLKCERDDLLENRRLVDEEVTTLRRAVQQQQMESKNRQSMLESKIIELETITKTLPKGSSMSS